MVNNGLDDQPASLLATRTQGLRFRQVSNMPGVLDTVTMREHVGSQQDCFLRLQLRAAAFQLG